MSVPPRSETRAINAWNPEQYERFSAERAEPFWTLVGLLGPTPSRARVLDLGCGTGALTVALHEHLGAGETLGVDHSEAMLAQARPRAVEGVRFAAGDISDLDAAPVRGAFDVVLSNAALQWVPDNEAALAAMAARLRVGGQLAVQVPCNDDQPMHTTAAAVAAEAPFAQTLGGWTRRTHVLTVDAYARAAVRLGLVDVHARVQVFLHPVEDREALVAWARGSLLTAYQSRLDPPTFARFLDRYRQRLAEQVADAPGVLTYKRTFLRAQKPHPTPDASRGAAP